MQTTSSIPQLSRSVAAPVPRCPLDATHQPHYHHVQSSSEKDEPSSSLVTILQQCRAVSSIIPASSSSALITRPAAVTVAPSSASVTAGYSPLTSLSSVVALTNTPSSRRRRPSAFRQVVPGEQRRRADVHSMSTRRQLDVVDHCMSNGRQQRDGDYFSTSASTTPATTSTILT